MVLKQKDLYKMLDTAIVAGRLAGQRAMEEIDFVKTSQKKNGSELVTQTDVRCQQIIIDEIKQSYPDHGFIAEEGEQGRLFKQTPRGSEAIWWVIDPIDGTNNFAHQMPIFTVSIASIYEGVPVVGVIFEPATDSIFTAIRGSQAQLNGRKISASEEDIDQFSSIALDSHFDCSNGVPIWACQIMQRTRFRNLGTTALEIAYVAKGSLIATIVNTPKLWDIAAGAVIAEAAKAIVSDWNGQRIFPVDLDRYEGNEFKTIVANKKVHAQIVELLKS